MSSTDKAAALLLLS